MRRLLILLVTSSILLSSCASIEGTRNKSYTYKSSGNYGNINKLAILPIEETSKFPMLSDMLEQRISDEFRFRYPNIKIINSNELNNELYKSNNQEMFASWFAGYKATKHIDFDKLNAVTSNTSTEYIIFIRSLNVDREKIRGVDTGYSGMISDANNVLRTNLKFIGELIDLKQRKIVWQGIGYAENINSPHRDLDLLLVIKNFRSPEVEELLGELVSVAAKGFVNEMMKVNK